jgi:NADPH-dependent 2,4-dienoyl-CoA reductase/sulfur reductase-like enzyme
VLPDWPGLSLRGVFALHTMEDGVRLKEHLQAHPVRSAVIIGSGYIGLEMADALTHLGLDVTLIGRSQAVLPTTDTGFGRIVEEALRAKGVRVESATTAQGIVAQGEQLAVETDRAVVTTDIVIVAAGVRPNSEIGSAIGLATGLHGALRVTRGMETALPNIYAAGDCVETWHRVLNRYTYLPLGTTAHKQGRVAGENAIGGRRTFEGSLGTQVVKVFDLAIARTGLREAEAAQAGFDPVTVESHPFDHKAYYPGAQTLRISVTGDRRSGRLLGAQMLGPWDAEVSKRIDIYAAALYHGMTVEDLNSLDLSYTPPLGSPWDAVQMAAQAWSRAALHRSVLAGVNALDSSANQWRHGSCDST